MRPILTRDFRRRQQRPRSSNDRGSRFRPQLEALEERALLSVYTVDRLTDLGEGAGLAGDLRYCITQANAVPGDDTIAFAVTGVINLTGDLPNLNSNIEFQGPGAGLLSVRANTGDYYGVFLVTGSASVVLSGLTITNATAGGIINGGTLTLNSSTVSGNRAFDQGNGGIYNVGTLTLNNSTVSDNDAGFEGYGGGIWSNGGTVTLNNSTVSGNRADLDGAGILVSAGAVVTLNNSTVSGNNMLDYISGLGAGIAIGSGTVTLNNSTVSGNDAGFAGSGGGIYIGGGAVTLNNSTVSGNRADYTGGIIISGGTVTLNNSTVSGNSATGFNASGGGIRNQGTLTTRNTIIAGNTAATAPDLSGNLGSLGHNLIGNSSGGSGFHATDLLNVNPLLGPLQNNGGPTLTHALLPGSPAIDAGDNTGAPPFDQRGSGFPRIVNGTIDIGAFEVQSGTALPVVTVVATDPSAAETASGSDPGTFTLTRTGPTTQALTVTFALGGTAGNGSDYTTIATTATFAASSATATVTVSPIDDSLAEPSETVVLTLSAGAGYTVGTPGAAMVTILDNDANTPPVLQPVADRTVPATQQVVTVTLSATDADGDPLTYSATAQSLAYVLDQQYALTTDGNFYENAYGRNEKWVQGNGTGWYFILPNGELYQWHGGVPEAQGTLLGNIGTSYYTDPTLLVNAPINQPRATLSVVNNVLTITRDLSWVSGIVVAASVSDGRGGSDSKTFRVFVTAAGSNTPPVLAPISDRSITSAQQVVTVTLSATDADGDPITYSATGQSLAYVLDQQYELTTDGNFYENAYGRNERWVQGNGTGWYFILPNGALYQWHGGVPEAQGTLLGNIGTSYYTDPFLLVNAPINQPRATLSVSGNVLTITRDLSWVSAVRILVTASDGRGGSDSASFTLTVT